MKPKTKLFLALAWLAAVSAVNEFWIGLFILMGLAAVGCLWVIGRLQS